MYAQIDDAEDLRGAHVNIVCDRDAVGYRRALIVGPLSDRRGRRALLLGYEAAAALADVILLCGSKEGPLQSGSVAAKMGLLFIIDVLFNEYCRTHITLTEANREATAAAISAKLL